MFLVLYSADTCACFSSILCQFSMKSKLISYFRIKQKQCSVPYCVDLLVRLRLKISIFIETLIHLVCILEHPSFHGWNPSANLDRSIVYLDCYSIGKNNWNECKKAFKLRTQSSLFVFLLLSDVTNPRKK